MKMIMLIEHVEKKEKLSSKRCEMNKWSFGDAALLWWLIETLFTASLHFISIEIPDDVQIDDELCTFSNFFNFFLYRQKLEIWFSYAKWL